MIRDMITGLKPGGRIVFVEYRKEDPAVDRESTQPEWRSFKSP
jgi:hypothetical protein